MGAGSTLQKVALDGSGATVAAMTPITHAVAVHGPDVFFGAGPNVQKMPMAGGPVVTLAQGSSFVQTIAVSDTTVYWTASAGQIRSVPIGGGPIADLAGNESMPFGLAIDDTDAYFTRRGAMGAIARVPLGGGAVQVLSAGEPDPVQAVLDGSTLFWVAFGSGVRALPSGGVPYDLYAGAPGANAIAVDATHVYWSNHDEGIIRRVPKPQ